METKFFPEFKKFGIDLNRVEPALIEALIDIRTMSGIPITPSPVIAGWYRNDGSKTSRHYAVGRKSDAGDIFPTRSRALDLWLVILSHPRINGIGLYTDTKGIDGKPQIMIHIDTRPGKRVMWIRDKGVYFNEISDKKGFWNAFQNVIKMDT